MLAAAAVSAAENEATAFTEFDGWWKQYFDAEPVNRPALVKKGAALARARREAMTQLIQTNPEAALQKAFAEEYHSALPAPVQDSIERHVRGLAKLTVSKNKDGVTQRRVTLGDERWKAYLFGPRLELDSREEIPIHGVVLDGLIAVDGSPLEHFPKRESLLEVLRQSDGKKTCPICGEPGTIPTAVGDILLWFDSDEHLITCEKALVEKEASPEAEE